MPFIQDHSWEFIQTWQTRLASHQCSTAHDRLKDTPKFDLNSLRNLATIGDEEIFFSGSNATWSNPLLGMADLFYSEGDTRGNPIEAESSEDWDELVPLILDPKLFEPIDIRPEPFISKCRKPEKPSRFSGSAWWKYNRERKTYTRCKRHEPREKAAWKRKQGIEVAVKTRAEEERR